MNMMFMQLEAVHFRLLWLLSKFFLPLGSYGFAYVPLTNSQGLTALMDFISDIAIRDLES